MTGKPTYEELEQRVKELEKETEKFMLAEEALRKAHDALEKRVRERSAELFKSNEKMKKEIEERIQAEKETQTAKEVLDAIINNIPNQIFWKNRDLVYLGCNQVFADVTGMGTPQNVIGKNDYNFDRDSAHAESYREWDKKIMCSGEAIINLEESYHTAEGMEGTVLTSKVPLRDKKGEIFGLLGICTDITDRKQAEEAREKLIIELKEALAQVKTLKGLLPICAACKKIRDDKGYWNQIEGYIQKHSDALFSHGLCPECADKLYGEEDWYQKEDPDN